MASIDSLLDELDERMIAERIGIPHDEARMRFPLKSNTVRDFDEFGDVVGRYYEHHFAACVSSGGRLSHAEARGRAKEILEREYRRRNGDIVSAYNDAHAGTNGGLRILLDLIADALKAETVERYIRDAFHRHVAPNAWEQKVDIMRQFLSRFGPQLGPTIDVSRPERYAREHEELIRAFVRALQQTSLVFRRL